MKAGALKPLHLTNAYVDWIENGRDGRKALAEPSDISTNSFTKRMEFKSTKSDKSRTMFMPETLCSTLKAHRAEQGKEKLSPLTMFGAQPKFHRRSQSAKSG